MAFQSLHGHVLDLLRGLAEKLLGRGGDRDIVAFHLHLGHAVHAHRHPFAGVNFGRLHIDGQQLQREHVGLLDDGQDEGAAALDDAETARGAGAVGLDELVPATGDDEHLVRADLGVAPGDDGEEDEDDKDDSRDDNRDEAGAFEKSGEEKMGGVHGR